MSDRAGSRGITGMRSRGGCGESVVYQLSQNSSSAAGKHQKLNFLAYTKFSAVENQGPLLYNREEVYLILISTRIGLKCKHPLICNSGLVFNIQCSIVYLGLL